VQRFVEQRHAPRALPPFEASVALHTGDVTITELTDPLHGSERLRLPVGDAVSATMQLQKQAHALGWAAVASAEAVRNFTGAVRTGERALVTLPGRAAPLDVVQLLGFGA